MKVDEQEAEKLLNKVRDVSRRSRALYEETARLSAERSEIVREAMEAGIPRQQIADAAGTSRQMLHRIATRSTRG
ncbi:hypothetical protein [Corynebacterium mastitidis]|uniref:Uncharacterized protein n=1 Tax=Corynebacterium mastitidis TaxID=161890 RepID=A0A2N0X9G3_9CORY|nr:hypothetical protein [Corynebacterium mastitidis]PKF69341.1 hypothetical protein CXB45_02365 [Corynebacterium mastitidis]